MILLNIPLSVSGLVAVMVMLYLLATLSRRLGEVTKMRPYYRGFYAAMLGVALAIGIALLRQPGPEGDNYLLVYYALLTLAGLISLFIALRYWGWLFRERGK
ncbi:MAG TPA: hypothetical protein VIK33_17065 [Anaerolineae bacterium]